MDRYKKTKQIKENYRDKLPETKQEWPSSIRRAFAFIVAHLFNSQLTVRGMKEQCRINGKSFANRFHRHINQYPKEYILHHRIEAAKQMLKQTEVPATTVAISVGFNSLSSFANSFKAKENLTPSEWREQN